MTTQLGLYNQALTIINERKLTALEASEDDKEQSQKYLDLIWDNGAVDYCLELANWNFATRRVELAYSPSITPSFGLKYAFDKPSDWVRTAALCIDSYFSTPLLEYKDMAEYWLADYQTLYVEYISDDSQYGSDMSLWPQTFDKLVAAYLASEVNGNITGDDKLQAKADGRFSYMLSDAKAKDANNQPTKLPASGSWVNARGYGYGQGPRRRGSR